MTNLVKLTFTIELATGHGFELFATGVEMQFPDDICTFPKPKDSRCWQALELQHPDLFNSVPLVTPTERCGLCFTVTSREEFKKG